MPFLPPNPNSIKAMPNTYHTENVVKIGLVDPEIME